MNIISFLPSVASTWTLKFTGFLLAIQGFSVLGLDAAPDSVSYGFLPCGSFHSSFHPLWPAYNHYFPNLFHHSLRRLGHTMMQKYAGAARGAR